MIYPATLIWLAVSTAFALTHVFAVEASLYWFYNWFDGFMHVWGGILLGTGMHIMARFYWWPIRPSTLAVFAAITVVIVSWEVFEWWAGLFDSSNYWLGTSKDIVLGYTGGLLGHAFLRSRYNTTT